MDKKSCLLTTEVTEKTFVISVILQPTALYTTLADAVNGSQVVETEIHAVAQISFCAENEMTYLADAFSTRFPLQNDEKKVPVCSSRRREKKSATAEEQSESAENEYSIVAQRGEPLSYAIREGKAVASAVISGVLRAEDSSLSVSQKLLSFEMQLPDDICELSRARLLSYEVGTGQNRVSFSAEVEFEFETSD